jgi:toxin secretion/phage lysis holin
MSRKAQELNNPWNMHIKEIILIAKTTFSSLPIKASIAAICGFIMYSVGYDSNILTILAYLVVIDWIMGISIAIKRGKFTSWRLIRTGYKIVFYLLLVVAAHQVQLNYFIPNWFDDFVEFIIILTELKSILENAAMLGFKQALKIEEKLNQLLSEKFDRK